MAEIYKHSYRPLSMYGNVVALLRDHAPQSGVHLDIGCGYGAIAEAIRDELGLFYVGFDIAADGLESLRARGFEVHELDLSQIEQAETVIEAALRDRTLASITMLDTLEHIFNGRDILALLRRIAEADQVPLVVSVPNVAHKDIALKLLTGRWDITEAGLLDHTHCAFYTGAQLDRLTRSLGWREAASNDWLLEHSDQRFPADSPVLNPALPVGQFLRQLIDQSNPYAMVNQFVRLYRIDRAEPIELWNNRSCPSRVFLSVLIATDGSHPKYLERVLRALLHQTKRDFELLVVHPSAARRRLEPIVKRVRKVCDQRIVLLENDSSSRARLLNGALDRVSGRYVALLTEYDVIDERWIEAFHCLSGPVDGAVLQVGRDPPAPMIGMPPGVPSVDHAVRQLEPPSDFLLHLPFDLRSVAHVALPAGVFRELGLRFDPELPNGGDWDLICRIALLCGIRSSESVTVTLDPDVPALDQEQSLATRNRVLQNLNGGPVLLPSGSLVQLTRLTEQHQWLERKHSESMRELRDLGQAYQKLRAEHERIEADHETILGELGRAADQRDFADSKLAETNRELGLLAEADHQLRMEHARVCREHRSLSDRYQDLSEQKNLLCQRLDQTSTDLKRARDLNEELQLAKLNYQREVDRLSSLESENENIRFELTQARNEASLGRKLRTVVGAHALLRSFMRTFLAQIDEIALTPPAIEAEPFLSVITRTQGVRIRVLRDTLISLAGQNATNFEIILVLHRCDKEQSEAVHSLIREFPQSFARRVNILECARAGRVAPINDALAQVKGRYFTVLDDDDFVFGHWVHTFQQLASQAPGTVLRSTCARQDFELTPRDELLAIPRASSWFQMLWPSNYDSIDHLSLNYSPCMSVAFPATLVRDLELTFDETIDTAEDWSFCSRAAMLCGVTSSPEVTSVYRWWSKEAGSLLVHSQEVWNADRKNILDKANARPLMLPPGSVDRIIMMLDENRLLVEQRAALSAALSEAKDQVDRQRLTIEAVYRSSSWRLTGGLRFAGTLLRRVGLWRASNA